MSPVEPGRHYRGGEGSLGAPGAWTCPTCATKNVTPFENGCPACGAGTQAEVEKAVAARKAQEIPAEALTTALVGAAEAHVALLQTALTKRARLTVARALAHYAELGSPSTEELSRAQLYQWARNIAASLDTEEGDEA